MSRTDPSANRGVGPWPVVDAADDALPHDGAKDQTAFAERIRRESGLATGAVGVITDPAQADTILRTGQADIVLLAREMLRDPYWPVHAAQALHQPATWPRQYLRAAPQGSEPREYAQKKS